MDHNLRIKIENSQAFKDMPIFKQRLTFKQVNAARLNDLYHQGKTWGIDHLKQNPNISISDVKLIEEIL